MRSLFVTIRGKIDAFFDEAETYAKARTVGLAAFKKIPAWEGMLGALSGKQPIMVHANELRQIKSAVTWAKRRNYKIILAASRDSWRVAELLAKENIPVVFDNVFTLPQRDTDSHDAHFRASGILNKAGVKVAQSVDMGSLGASEVRKIIFSASRSMAYGLPHEAALKSITLHPAEMLGVNDRLGSLSPKKEATFIAVDLSLIHI